MKNFLPSGESYLFGVFDGHGVNGHHVSDFVKKTLPINLIEVYSRSFFNNIGSTRSHNIL